jgi:hypothetical protein
VTIKSSQRDNDPVPTEAVFPSAGRKGGQNGLSCAIFSAYSTRVNAGIAQLVEQLICNQQVVGSNPTAGSFNLRFEIMREPR